MKKNKLVIPFIITCFIALKFAVCIAFFAYMLVSNLFFSSMHRLGKLTATFFAVLGVLVFIALFYLVIKAFIERCNEIRSGEEDDLSQY